MYGNAEVALDPDDAVNLAAYLRSDGWPAGGVLHDRVLDALDAALGGGS